MLSNEFTSLAADYICFSFLLAHQIPAREYVNIQRDVNQQDFKIFDLYIVNVDNFHSFEVVDRVSETQIQVGKNSN